MKVWLVQHAQAFFAAFNRLRSNPLGAIFNILVMGIALALPALLYTGLDSLSRWSGQYGDDVRLSVLLGVDAEATAVAELKAKLESHAYVRSVDELPKQQALKALEKKLGLDNVAATLGENPLPDAFIVRANDLAQLSALRDEIGGWKNVGEVIWDAEWVRKLQAILEIAEGVIASLAALLAFGLLAITFNTVRLQVLTQKTEIEVASLIGATRPFIRRPFLYFGALQGLLAGAACLAIVTFAAHFLDGKIGSLNALYGSAFELTTPGLPEVLAVLALAAILGWSGAFMSVGRHLSRASASA